MIIKMTLENILFCPACTEKEPSKGRAHIVVNMSSQSPTQKWPVTNTEIKGWLGKNTQTKEDT